MTTWFSQVPVTYFQEKDVSWFKELVKELLYLGLTPDWSDKRDVHEGFKHGSTGESSRIDIAYSSFDSYIT